MEGEKIIESITKTINDRLKIPIIITYLSVLIIYNWDVLFYLIFEKETASIKIACIKEEYSSEYWCRIFTCIGISIILIGAFTIINTGLNYLLKWFYKKDKKFTSEIENYETIDNLRQQLADSIDKRNKLETDVKNLTKINEDINLKIDNLNLTEIAKIDYTNLLKYLKNSFNSGKITHSFIELIEILKEDSKVELNEIYKKASFPNEMELLLDKLFELNLLIRTTFQKAKEHRRYDGVQLGTSFKEFLKMDLK